MRAQARRGGFAMLIVLLTLMALLVLCTPFLMTVRNADQASLQGADRISLELALDAAGRIASARLGASHPALDSTPDYDSLAELGVDNDLGDALFLDPNDPRGVMFDLAVHDVSGRIDLNSAPPQVIGNLVRATAVTLAPVAIDDDEIRLSAAAGFLDAGFVWVDGELVGYAERKGNALTGLVRALGVELDGDGKIPPCGPRGARGIPANTVVIDQRAWALAQWRSWTPDGALRRLDAVEELAGVVPLILAEELGGHAYAALEKSGTVYAGIGAGREWQHASRVRNHLVAGMDCTLQLTDPRWFNEGATVRLTDGVTTELGIVRRAGNGSITLVDPVASDYAPFTATVQPLARRPVNVNTATPAVLEALLLNLQLRGRQSRIMPAEVDALIEVIVESRPFTSFEDFARRLILPAAGWAPLPPDAPVVPERFRIEEGLADASTAFLDEDDARALYKNALNANDVELVFSTMPFAFTSTDTHHMELRAAVNAPSGIERARGVREQVENVVPQQDLLFLATRQEDFEQLFRLDRDAAGWATGPWATSRHDAHYGSSPPTRSRAHLGPRDTMPADDPLTDGEDHVFAERDPALDDGFAMPWVAREEEVGRKQGRMLHFDGESRELEGRYLPDGTVVSAADDDRVSWIDGQGLLRPFAFSMWLKPEALEEGALFLDVGGTYSDSDRASLAIEQGDLVLRVLDAAGDHPATTFEEVAEARYPLATGAGPGMPLDTWIHVSVDVRGTRPDQMVLLVDGRWHAEQPGLTRLSSALGPDDQVIGVESTEGFPERCVLRIGEELVEAVVSGATSFTALFASEGEGAGFGGRLARVEFVGVEGSEVPVDLFETTAYGSGTTVELYGYSLRIQGNVSNGQGQLASGIGGFAVGRAVAEDASGLQDISVQLADGTLFSLGQGVETAETMTLQLVSADAAMPVEQMMSAFDPGGGYALLASAGGQFEIAGSGPTVPSTTVGLTSNGHVIGGAEVVRYSGWQGTELSIDQRGDAVDLPGLAGAVELGASGSLTTKHAWVLDWNDGLTILDGIGGSPDNRMVWQTKVIPISLRVSGAQSLDPLSGGAGGASGTADARFAQITHLGGDAGLTEWIRYDEAKDHHLVRDDPTALLAAWTAAQAGDTNAGRAGGTAPGGTIPGGGGGGGAGGGGPAPPLESLLGSLGPPEPPAAAATVDGAYWHYRMGEREYKPSEYPISLAVNSRLQFRGVLGTFDHAHPPGTVVLPVWKAVEDDVDAGRMGRFDAVTLIDSQPTDPGFPGVVQRAHRPREYTVYAWSEDPADPLLKAAPEEPAVIPHVLADAIYVALQEAVQVPVAGGSDFLGEDGANQIYDTRLFTRANKFPSGELPRGVTTVAVGGSYLSSAGVPAATVDELVFGDTDFVGGEDLRPAQMVLSAALTAEEDTFGVWPNDLRVALGRLSVPNGRFLTSWPADGGLVRIGDEVLCYTGYDADSGTVVIAESGRGMLGSDPQAHAAGEPVALLQHVPVSILAAGVGAADGILPLRNGAEFPSAGLVWIEDELVHYTWQDGGALGMPLASSEPGAMDRKGAGLFRGRFGTTPAAHAAGVPVVLHPFRYWDRWAERADAPEMHYLGASVAQPAAFWRTMFFDVEATGTSGPRLGVLQRTDPSVPWDADPREEAALEEIYDGLRGGSGVGVGAQTDRIEWRVFVRWDAGSYDPVDGLLHGWKTAPRLRFLGGEYLAPPRMLRRVAR